jgi:O-antigen ligase
VLPALILASLPLLVSPRARVLFLVFGSILVFGPRDVNAPKLAFLCGLAVSFVAALLRSRTLSRTPAYKDLSPLFGASVALLALVLVSFSVAMSNGVSALAWFRDVHPYVLLAWAPLFAFDAQSAFSGRGLRRLIALAGITGAALFTLNWLARRAIASPLPAQFGLTTFLLGAALFAFAMAVALDGNRARLRWLALASLIFALLATTGTRSSAVLLAAPLAIVAGTRRRLMKRSLRLAIALPLAALLVAIAAQTLVRVTHANAHELSRRVELLLHAGGSSDQSYVDRLREIHSAWTLFKTEPVFGVGPGHTIPWQDASGNLKANTFVDTPVGFLPDFGLFGVVVVGLIVASFVSVLRRLRRRTGQRTTAQLALVGFSAVVVAWSVLQVPFEDKGLSTGLVLLLALALGEAASAASSNVREDPDREQARSARRSRGPSGFST